MHLGINSQVKMPLGIHGHLQSSINIVDIVMSFHKEDIRKEKGRGQKSTTLDICRVNACEGR